MRRTSFAAHLAMLAMSAFVGVAAGQAPTVSPAVPAPTVSTAAPGTIGASGAVGAMPFGTPAVDATVAAGPTPAAADATYAGAVYGVGEDGYSFGGPGSYAFGYPTNELFYNYYVPPVNGGIGAAMYPSPLPTPPYVGHVYFTYQPFYPQEMLYRHHRTHYRPHPGFEGYPGGATPYTRTDVRWTNSRSPLQFAPSILRSRPPLNGAVYGSGS